MGPFVYLANWDHIPDNHLAEKGLYLAHSHIV